MVTLKQSELSQFLGGSSLPPPGSPVSWASFTHRGLVRSENEDALCIETNSENDETPRYLFAIADGSGRSPGRCGCQQISLNGDTGGIS